MYDYSKRFSWVQVYWDWDGHVNHIGQHQHQHLQVHSWMRRKLLGMGMAE